MHDERVIGLFVYICVEGVGEVEVVEVGVVVVLVW